jgi:hypothetical protein
MTGSGRSATVESGGRDQLLARGLHLSLLRNLERVVNLDPEVSDGTLTFAMTDMLVSTDGRLSTLLGHTPNYAGRLLRRDSGHRADADQLTLSARSGPSL